MNFEDMFGEARPPGAENGNGTPVAVGDAVKLEAGQPHSQNYYKRIPEETGFCLDDMFGGPEIGNADVARDLASRGFAVFPICDWGGNGEWLPINGWPEKATADSGQVAAWWGRWPDARVGLPAGECNGITVLDLDAKNGKDGIKTLAALGFPNLPALSPVRVLTPSGGWHLFFRHDARLKNWAGKIGEGIDVRNDRGFVIAPGSRKGGSRYQVTDAMLGSRDLPAFPEALIPPPEPEREPVEAVIDATDEQREWAGRKLADLAGDLAEMAEGGRNDAINAAAMWAGGAAAHGFLIKEDTRVTLWVAAERAGLCKREFERTFAGAFKAGLRKPISDYPRTIDADTAMNEEPEADDFEVLAKDKEPRLRLLSPGECADAPSRGYIIKGFVAPGDLGCIFGAPGAGKSLISPHLGYAVAQGRGAFVMRTKASRVFYVAAEDPHGMRGRVSALKLRNGDADDFTLVEGVSDLLVKGSPDFTALLAAVAEHKPSLIFIDTLAMAFPGLEENSAEDMGRVVALARRLTAHGAAVVLIHHDTKAGTPTPRGHSLLNGALDMALQLFAKDESGVVRGKLTKNRNGSCDRDIAFRIATEYMGDDEDGDPITVAIVDEMAPGTSAPRQKLSPSERAALKILSDMIQISRNGAVPEDGWRTACIDARTVSASEDRESRRKATKRAFEGLARKSAVILRNRTASTPDFSRSAAWSEGSAFDDDPSEEET